MEELLQQFFVVVASLFCRIGEIFALRDLWIGIGFQHIWVAPRRPFACQFEHIR
jgi:hypothetical protein